ncbi:transcriptional regulator [Pyrococcus furiosus DSM 3638]|uniref:Transcriptional regulator n=3 Tax=Pyrococcus furiosus TaxID=2261 RepID=A0A5C0XMV2_PYRFU|nr:phosphate uptake regulator PhoU [Pyrococcus furiosus]AAL80265.1 hypothetical protein PF0141 [Pyrococcus furiosus DSM 3638]AFN04435.1 hypothetical protein PFC_07495 [Pyrococcus furiosus COM1]QEK77871.1 transcriptional regulator [Pyrococcus furiosus DSM 3638]
MEFRKIQFTGRSSYIVSLPKAWIREHGLKQGDLVSLVFNPDGSITIFPGKPKEEEETKTIEITEKFSPDMAIRLVISAYIQGYDTIEIIINKELPIYKVYVRKILQSLPGVEIISEEPQKIVAKSLLDEEEISFGEILSRMKSIIISMFEDLYGIINSQEAREELLRDLNDLENELDRFYFLMIRTVNRILLRKGSFKEETIIKRTFDLIGILLIARNIERIGDHIIRIAENPGKIDVGYLKEKFVQVIREIERKNLERLDKLMLELSEEAKKINYRESVAMDSYRRILEYLENIGETIINMAIS